MTMVDPVLIRAAQLPRRRARLRSSARSYFPANAAARVHRPEPWAWESPGVSLIAAEMISGQFGIGYFTWEAYSLVQYADIALGMICIGVLGLGSRRADPRPRAPRHAMGQEK